MHLCRSGDGDVASLNVKGVVRSGGDQGSRS